MFDRKAYSQKYYQENQDKLRAYSRKYQHEHKNDPKHVNRAWARGIKHRFGITPGEYSRMLIKQKGVCAICGESEGKKLAVDHSHTSGKIRGLLCGKCNTKLGWYEKQKTNIIKYLGE